MISRKISLLATSSLFLLSAFATQAADFTIVNGQNETTAQSIGPGANETAIVENGGTLTVGTGSAITSSSVGGHITNNGTITENDGFLGAVQLTASGQLAINNGTIHASGVDAEGLYAAASGNMLINNGLVTIGQAGGGVVSFNNGVNDSVFINNGTITTEVGATDEIVALGSLGTGATVTNNGAITLNTSLSAALLVNINATSSNSGHITIVGDNAWGIDLSGIGATTRNSGTINVTGATDVGIYAQQNNQSIINTGVVTNIGSGQAIRVDGNSTTVINHGIITSTGGDAVQMNGDSDTLVLGSSLINGPVVFAGTNGALQYDISAGHGGSVSSINGTITGTHTTSTTGMIPRGAHVVQSGNTIAVVTPDNFALNNQVVGQTLNYTGDLVTHRQQLALLGETTGVAGGAQYAAATGSLSDAAPAYAWGMGSRKAVWAEGFGSYQELGASGEAASSTVRAGGVLGGVDLPQNDNGYRIGLYGGAFTGSTDLGDNNFRQTDSNGVLAGGYIGHSYDEYFVSAQFATGYSSNESDRFTGVDTANSSYSSYFVSPSLTVMRPMEEGGITWIPSANVHYTAQFDGSYDESGSVANQSVDSRTIQSAGARLMLEAVLKQQKLADGILKPSLRAGIDGQTLLGSNDVNVNTLGSNLSFDPRGGMNYIDGIVGTNLSYAVNNGPQIYLDGEADLGLNKGGPGNNKGITTRFGSRWAF